MILRLRNHVVFVRHPGQRHYACATCAHETRKLRDRLDHASLARLPHRPLKETA